MDILSILLTATLGGIVFLFGQCFLKYLIEPVFEYRKTREELFEKLRYFREILYSFYNPYREERDMLLIIHNELKLLISRLTIKRQFFSISILNKLIDNRIIIENDSKFKELKGAVYFIISKIDEAKALNLDKFPLDDKNTMGNRNELSSAIVRKLSTIEEIYNIKIQE
jgi:hypothetical protein